MGFFFRQTGGNEALAADLTQDTFMRVWMARDRFSGTSFHTWLLTIGYNLLKNHYRHSEHEKDYESFAMQTQEEAGDNDVIDQLDQEAFDQVLSRLLEKMPPESRLLFSLRFEEELTVPQIAVVMAVPEGTVKSRLHILTQTLKQKLRSS
jgi:RNA polymerase sigma-70 factor (ECF subfamily)